MCIRSDMAAAGVVRSRSLAAVKTGAAAAAAAAAVVAVVVVVVVALQSLD